MGPNSRFFPVVARAEGPVNLDQLAISIERLRKEAIGEPLWLAEKQVFEYQDHSAKVVAILKLVRAMHGVNSIELLCRKRFFIDFLEPLFGALMTAQMKFTFYLRNSQRIQAASISSSRNFLVAQSIAI